MSARGLRPSRLEQADWMALGLLLALAGALRWVFLSNLDVPPYDPWRHLALIRNLREGAGFTLFAGQEYLWYPPLWHRLCALLAPFVRPETVAGLFSLAAVPVAYLVARLQPGEARPVRHGAIATGLLAAAAGPVVGFTCHYGPEALTWFSTWAALLALTVSRGSAGAAASGLLFGIGLVARLNFVFCGFLFLPWLANRRRAALWGAGAALPLVWAWWRNARIIARHDYVFTWDGLATPTEQFGFLSTLVVQLHPSLQEGLRRLHELVVPRPEWFVREGRIAWDTMLFMLCGALALVVCRRLGPALAGFSALAYFLVLDSSMSSNFFRIYLVAFPAFFLAAGAWVRGTSESGSRPAVAAAWALVGLSLVGGASYLRPAPMAPLEAVTVPQEFLAGHERYMVNSAVYHPEGLIYRYPEKEFIGLPLRADELDAFLEQVPTFRAVLWHDFGVQDDVVRRLEESPQWRVSGVWANDRGRTYRLFELREAGE
ncbi:MAG: hypothetical protein GY716_14575 [bacterium]|nr:hypothetical protein [bacterium]